MTMIPRSERPHARRDFRRAFLWTLAAFALLWSFQLPADDVIPAGPAIPPALGDETDVRVSARPFTPSAADITESMPQLPPTSAPPPAPLPPYEPASIQSGRFAPQATVTRFHEENWSVTIIPRATREVQVNGIRYEDAYAAIPYRRAEYLANPGYRHEAAIEVMFGQLRPKTVVSEYQPQVVPTPVFSVYKPYRASQRELLNYSYRPFWGAPYSWSFPLSPYYPRYPTYPLLY